MKLSKSFDPRIVGAYERSGWSVIIKIGRAGTTRITVPFELSSQITSEHDIPPYKTNPCKK